MRCRWPAAGEGARRGVCAPRSRGRITPRRVDQSRRSKADISERYLIAAAERLGVRTHRGQWWLPVRGETTRHQKVLVYAISYLIAEACVPIAQPRTARSSG
jgi:hypothetical protein